RTCIYHAACTREVNALPRPCRPGCGGQQTSRTHGKDQGVICGADAAGFGVEPDAAGLEGDRPAAPLVEDGAEGAQVHTGLAVDLRDVQVAGEFLDVDVLRRPRRQPRARCQLNGDGCARSADAAGAALENSPPALD